MRTATMTRPGRRSTTASLTVGIRRNRPHVPHQHPDIPGVCSTCRLPIVVDHQGRYVNDRHMTLSDLLRTSLAVEYDVMAAAAGEMSYG